MTPIGHERTRGADRSRPPRLRSPCACNVQKRCCTSGAKTRASAARSPGPPNVKPCAAQHTPQVMSSSPTSFGTLSCFLPRPPRRTILRISSTRLAGESAYLSNKNEVPDDEHRARPPLDAEAVHGVGTAAADADWMWAPRISRCNKRHLNPRGPIRLDTGVEGRRATTARAPI